MSDSPPRAHSSTALPDYVSWAEAAAQLVRPLAELMIEGRADLALEGPASNHGPAADRLEAYARPCLLAAHWLAAESGPEPGLDKERIAAWFRAALLCGTDPRHPEFWGYTANYHQHTVEMCAMSLAFQKARQWLWDPLSGRERAQVAHWFGSIRGIAHHRNNHLFFGVLTLDFLEAEGFGLRTDRAESRHALDVLESMYLGEGWFIDGMNESLDYYNPYAFHYYGLWWAILFGKTDPVRADRWKSRTHDFLETYAHFFAATGENPPFGRSMCYRFAATAPFALAELAGCSPLPPGLARQICSKNLAFFLSHPVTQSQGVLSIGWTDEFPPLAEAYSCAASPYWAAKGLTPLLLPPDSAFWTDEPVPLPAETGDSSRPIAAAGLLVQNTAGAVEILHTQSKIGVSNTGFGPWKWGKLSYRSGFGFDIRRADGPHPLDAALTATDADGTIFGRHATHPVELEENHAASLYSLGDRFTQFNVQVESHLWCRGSWHLHLHLYKAYQPALLRLGSYAVPASAASEIEVSGAFPCTTATNGRLAVCAQSVGGFTATSIHRTPGADGQRVHLTAPCSATLTLELRTEGGSGWLAGLLWAGDDGTVPEPWKIRSLQAGKWTLQHSAHGDWHIVHPALPA